MELDSRYRIDRVLEVLLGLICILAMAALSCPVQTSSTSAMTGPSFFSAIEDYYLDWFPAITRIQSEQPHWIMPIFTVTPRLEEEFRYDQFWQRNQYGQATDNFGSSKGAALPVSTG